MLRKINKPELLRLLAKREYTCISNRVERIAVLSLKEEISPKSIWQTGLISRQSLKRARRRIRQGRPVQQLGRPTRFSADEEREIMANLKREIREKNTILFRRVRQEVFMIP